MIALFAAMMSISMTIPVSAATDQAKKETVTAKGSTGIYVKDTLVLDNNGRAKYSGTLTEENSYQEYYKFTPAKSGILKVSAAPADKEPVCSCLRDEFSNEFLVKYPEFLVGTEWECYIRNYTLKQGNTYLIGVGNRTWRKSNNAYTVAFEFKADPSKPNKTSITKLKKGSKRFKVSVKKQSVTGYQLQYSLKSNFKGSKIKTFKGTSYTVKGLKAKKKYYVRVRSYNTSNDKTLYSAWSAKKSVKTKNN